jgi:type IV pilus assembly protein PilA
MYFALMGKLSARRQNLSQDKDKGFTLIELLVVVIIIGILAAIAIPVYLGVQNNAKDSAVKSDLSNIKPAIVASYTADNSASTTPALTTAVLGKYGYTQSADYTGTNAAIPSYAASSTSSNFCVNAKGSTGNPFHVSTNSGVVEGACGAVATW